MLFFFSSLLHLSVLSSCVSFSVCLSLIFTLCRYMCVCGSLCWALSQGGGSSSWWGQSPEGLWVGKGRLWLCSHHRSVAFECVHSLFQPGLCSFFFLFLVWSSGVQFGKADLVWCDLVKILVLLQFMVWFCWVYVLTFFCLWFHVVWLILVYPVRRVLFIG